MVSSAEHRVGKVYDVTDFLDGMLVCSFFEVLQRLNAVSADHPGMYPAGESMELELELKTFYLNLALALMLENTLVGLSVFRGC